MKFNLFLVLKIYLLKIFGLGSDRLLNFRSSIPIQGLGSGIDDPYFRFWDRDRFLENFRSRSWDQGSVIPNFFLGSDRFFNFWDRRSWDRDRF
jgi:hypothetical protein